MKDYTGIKNNMLTAVKYIETKNNSTYWLFNCDCGNEKVLRANKVMPKNSSTKSCGCLRLSINSGNPSLNCIINSYKKGAKNRNLEYLLNKDDFLKLTSGNCHYCGVVPSNIRKTKNSLYIYNGIDRINNELGYVLQNCVSCCTLCNKAKRDLNYTVFYNWVKRLSEYQYKNYING